MCPRMLFKNTGIKERTDKTIIYKRMNGLSLEANES